VTIQIKSVCVRLGKVGNCLPVQECFLILSRVHFEISHDVSWKFFGVS